MSLKYLNKEEKDYSYCQRMLEIVPVEGNLSTFRSNKKEHISFRLPDTNPHMITLMDRVMIRGKVETNSTDNDNDYFCNSVYGMVGEMSLCYELKNNKMIKYDENDFIIMDWLYNMTRPRLNNRQEKLMLSRTGNITDMNGQIQFSCPLTLKYGGDLFKTIFNYNLKQTSLKNPLLHIELRNNDYLTFGQKLNYFSISEPTLQVESLKDNSVNDLGSQIDKQISQELISNKVEFQNYRGLSGKTQHKIHIKSENSTTRNILIFPVKSSVFSGSSSKNGLIDHLEDIPMSNFKISQGGSPVLVNGDVDLNDDTGIRQLWYDQFFGLDNDKSLHTYTNMVSTDLNDVVPICLNFNINKKDQLSGISLKRRGIDITFKTNPLSEDHDFLIYIINTRIHEVNSQGVLQEVVVE
jgi:hypothetical protein